MSLIDGVGDEVIEFFIGLSIVLIGAIAWWSTRIADRPLIRTVLVFERRSQNISERAPAPDTNAIQEQRNYVEEVQPVQAESTEERQENKPPTAGSSGENDDLSDSQDTMSIEEEQSAIVEQMDSDASILRRRRLKFFQNHHETLITPTDVTMPDTSNGEELESVPESAFIVQENLDTVMDSDDQSEEPIMDENDIRIKLKYINDDLKLVNGKLQEQLGDFKRRHFELELANNKLVRLIFNGQVLQRDDQTLQGCGLFDNCVVHCLVHQKRPNPMERQATGANLNIDGNADMNRTRTGIQSGTSQTRDWDLGNLFFAIISFILGAAWYFRYEYAQLYTVTATVALVGLTGIFTVLLVGMYFPDAEPPMQNVRS